MKKQLTIAILLLTLLSAKAQQDCLPAYNNPIKKVTLKEGIQIGYIEKGKGETILFIHGLGGNLSHWEKSIASLSKKYHCIAIDLPGYGYSIPTDTAAVNDQLEVYANIILSFINKMKLKNLTLAGHSMGGQIAIITTLKDAVNIKKLVLVAPAGFETFSAAESTILTNLSTPAYFKNQDEAAIRASFKRNFYLQPADAASLISFRIAMKSCTSIDAYCNTIVKGIRGMLAHPVKLQLGLLKQPVLIVYGENDELIPNKYLHPKTTTKEVAEEGSQLIKHYQLIMIPQAGHMLQYEKPEELNNALIKFLSNNN